MKKNSNQEQDGVVDGLFGVEEQIEITITKQTFFVDDEEEEDKGWFNKEGEEEGEEEDIIEFFVDDDKSW
jgi:hypothetical protein